MPDEKPTTRKNIALEDSMWTDIAAVRKTFGVRIPSETETIRILLREALDARARRDARKDKK